MRRRGCNVLLRPGSPLEHDFPPQRAAGGTMRRSDCWAVRLGPAGLRFKAICCRRRHCRLSVVISILSQVSRIVL